MRLQTSEPLVLVVLLTELVAFPMERHSPIFQPPIFALQVHIAVLLALVHGPGAAMAQAGEPTPLVPRPNTRHHNHILCSAEQADVARQPGIKRNFGYGLRWLQQEFRLIHQI